MPTWDHPDAAPERRRPRRPDEVTYRVRVDLEDIQPPVWRRLELSSQLHLDQMHQVLQHAFSWTDSHLHRFSSGASELDPAAEMYLCPFDVEEGEDEGIPEEEVRLDEVLVEPGDVLRYAYDYGDGWEHLVRLEEVEDAALDVAARCTDGRRAGPPEDCGGPLGYQELVDSGLVDAEDFDVAGVNTSLSGYGSLRNPREDDAMTEPKDESPLRGSLADNADDADLHNMGGNIGPADVSSLAEDNRPEVDPARDVTADQPPVFPSGNSEEPDGP